MHVDRPQRGAVLCPHTTLGFESVLFDGLSKPDTDRPRHHAVWNRHRPFTRGLVGVHDVNVKMTLRLFSFN